MTLKLTAIMITSLLFTACSFSNGINSFEEIYTDVTVVKPTAKNYKAYSGGTSLPIIKETTKEPSAEIVPQSVHLKKTGSIISVNYDKELKLYMYNFLVNGEEDQVVFYYDQKLNHPSTLLLDVDILDNYLVTARKHPVQSSKNIPEKKKYIKHKRKNRNIREAIEEKINTF